MFNSTDTADDPINLPPPKKRLKKSHFDAKSKELILKLYEREIQDNPFLIIGEIVQKVANGTGVCVASIYRIIREYKEKREFSEPKTNQNRKHIIDLVDEFHKSAIRRIVHQYFFRSELPTIDKVFKDVNEDPDLPNFKRTTFYKLLNSLNFYSLKQSRKSMLIEKDKIVLRRREYLRKIKTYRNENRKIYYLDETWLNNAGHKKPKVWVDNEVDNSVSTSRQAGFKTLSGNKEKRLLICHIGSDDGFVPNGLWAFESKEKGEFHEEMDGNSFEKWFADILPQLEENSIIVLDNAPYHSRKLEEIPTTATRKPDVQQWLRSKNINFEEDLLKVELLFIVKEHKKKYDKYVIDEMAKAQNQTVLRLPPFHCELNPIELIWADVKNFVAEHKPFADMNIVFNDAINNITADKWQQCVNHVKDTVEKEMWKIDDITEVQVEPLIVKVEGGTSSDEDN